MICEFDGDEAPMCEVRRMSVQVQVLPCPMPSASASANAEGGSFSLRVEFLWNARNDNRSVAMSTAEDWAFTGSASTDGSIHVRSKFASGLKRIKEHRLTN